MEWVLDICNSREFCLQVPRCHEMLFIVEPLREITPFFAGVLKYSLGMKYAICKHLSLQEMNDGEANQTIFLELS